MTLLFLAHGLYLFSLSRCIVMSRTSDCTDVIDGISCRSLTKKKIEYVECFDESFLHVEDQLVCHRFDKYQPQLIDQCV